MSVRRCGNVWLTQAKEDWQFDCSCRTAAKRMEVLLRGNPSALKRRVLKPLSIDMETRRKEGNLIFDDGKPREIDPKDWLAINRGLAMELLSAAMLTCLGRPRQVKAHCQIGDSGKINLAGHSGVDIEVDHETFDLVVEVSGMQRVDKETWRKQLNQAIDHSEPEQFGRERRTIYALAINNGNMEQRGALLNDYRKIINPTENRGEDAEHAENSVEEAEPAENSEEDTKSIPEDVRLIPIWAWDFAQIIFSLSKEDHPVGLHFSAEDLERALDTIYENIVEQLSNNKPGWTRAAFLAVLEGKPFPGEEEARERAALGEGAAVEIRPIEPVDLEWVEEWLGMPGWPEPDSEPSEEPGGS